MAFKYCQLAAINSKHERNEVRFVGKNIKKLLIIKISFILTILGVFGTGINVYADNVLPSNASEISREISTLESDSQTSKIIADKNEIKSLDQESPPDTKISDEITDNSVTKNTSAKKSGDDNLQRNGHH